MVLQLLSPARCIVIALMLAAMATATPGYATLVRINLATGPVVLTQDTTAVFLEALAKHPRNVLFGLGAFSDDVSPEDRLLLEQAGISLLTYYGERAYGIRIERKTDLSHPVVKRLLIALALIPPPKKMDQSISKCEPTGPAITFPGGAKSNYEFNADGTLNLTVVFFPSVPPNEVSVLLQQYSKNPVQLNDETWVVTLTCQDLKSLANDDRTVWIQPAPSPVGTGK